VAAPVVVARRLLAIRTVIVLHNWRPTPSGTDVAAASGMADRVRGRRIDCAQRGR
jgi:hypothetical protein